MTKILGFSGRKQAGKNTAANFLFGLEVFLLTNDEGAPLFDWFKISKKGELILPFDFGEKGVLPGIFNPLSREPAVQCFLAENVWPAVKMYSFADVLKELCMSLFGLTDNQCYGTDDDKNSLTDLLWENMPGVVTDEDPKGEPTNTSGRLGFYYDKYKEFVFHKPGRMTAREVLQFFGTEIGRKMYQDVWVKTTIDRIKAEGTELALITDVRFPNEVMGVQGVGGKVIRLTRAPFKEDTHASEIALDNYKGFDLVIDNENLDIEKQNKEVFDAANKLEFIKVQPESLPA